MNLLGNVPPSPYNRVPAVWVIPGTTRLRITSPVPGSRYAYVTGSMPLGQRIRVGFRQRPIGTGMYLCQTYLNGRVVNQAVHQNSMEYRDVAAYSGAEGYPAATGRIVQDTLYS